VVLLLYTRHATPTGSSIGLGLLDDRHQDEQRTASLERLASTISHRSGASMSNYYEGIPFGSKIGRGRRRGRSFLPIIVALAVAFGALYILSQQASWLWAGGEDGPKVAPSPGPVAAVIVELTPVPSPVPPTSTPRPAPTPSPEPSPTPAPEPAVMQVANTGGLGVYMRRTPTVDERIRAWVEGTRMTVIGPDQVVGGTTWRNVKDPAGNEGWVPAQYLIPAPAVPEATPTQTAG
jgi:hypothetical protein